MDAVVSEIAGDGQEIAVGIRETTGGEREMAMDSSIRYTVNTVRTDALADSRQA